MQKIFNLALIDVQGGTLGMSADLPKFGLRIDWP